MDAEEQLQALLDQAGDQLDAGNTREALATLQRAAAIDAEDPTVLMLQAMAWTAEGKVQDALGALDRAQQADPDDVMLLMTRGNLLMDQLDDAYEALPCFEEAVLTLEEDRPSWDDEEPERRDALNALLHEALLQLSICRAVLDDGPGALEAVQEAVRIRPDDARTHVALAQAYIDVSDLKNARLAAEKAQSLDGRMPEAFATAGHIALLQGNQAEGESLYGRAAQLDGERFFLPAHMESAVLLEEIRNDTARLPQKLASWLADVDLRVMDAPPASEWAALDPPRSASLSALTDGEPPAVDGPEDAWASRPDSITIYRVNLEVVSRNAEELVESAVATVVMEALAFLGLDLDELDEDDGKKPARR